MDWVLCRLLFWGQAGASIDSRGYISKLSQLENFDWLSEAEAEQCVEVLGREVIPKRVIREAAMTHGGAKPNLQFEYLVEEEVMWDNSKPVHVQGLVDILSDEVLWEVKCVESLSDEHFLQLGVYAWLWRRNNQVILTSADHQSHHIRKIHVGIGLEDCVNMTLDIIF